MPLVSHRTYASWYIQLNMPLVSHRTYASWYKQLKHASC